MSNEIVSGSASSRHTSEDESPSASSAMSPAPQTGSASQCQICQSLYSVTRLRHTCRMCRGSVCGYCSQQRIRLVVGGAKERVCDNCAYEWRHEHAGQLEEAVDVRIQINLSLKSLLKEKHTEVESLKRYLVDIVESHPYLQEPPSLHGPSRFSSEIGLERINFIELVRYLDERVEFLKKRRSEISESLNREMVSQEERRTNFGFLQERTHKAESDAKRVSELSLQRDRLRDTFREQSYRIRSLQDRVEMLELGVSIGESGPLETVTDENMDFFADRIADMIFPCLR